MKKFAGSGHKKTNPIYRGSCLVEASAKTEASSEDGSKPIYRGVALSEAGFGERTKRVIHKSSNSTVRLASVKLSEIMSNDLKDKTQSELEQITTSLGQKKYLAKYIFQFIHAEDAADISQITPLSKPFRAKLNENKYHISQLNILNKLTDKDGTIKYVFGLDNGNRIETVLLLDGKRRTLCVSTQAGCKMGCVFCATGKIKFQRNLSAGEIIDQIYTVQKDSGKISNIVYMGMGEPLENYDAVGKSVQILNDPAGRNIGIRHITVSTCGLAPAIKKLAYEKLHPRLAISLNAPTNELRTSLMPINKKYPITKLLDAVRTYQFKVKERVTFEYIMIKGINDSLLHAGQLVKLLRGMKCNVNLIEYNPHGGCKFKGSGMEKISRFAEVIEEAGIENTIRLKKGSSICAACGQLGASIKQ
ncbi:MAG: 23S rRNA (adenine(2503)-C(2))-methyltransferase RlmN [Planctomycetes bacterium]|nr:23S rRNA (adenine(2503)-C(2))-methyltransferase RlmN [Planctomycetota bacterium]